MFYTHGLISLYYHIEELNKNNLKINIDLNKTIITETGWQYKSDNSNIEWKKLSTLEIYKKVYDDIISFNKEKISMNIDGKLYEYKSPVIIHYFTINNATDYDKASDTVLDQYFGANILLSDSDKNLLDNLKTFYNEINKSKPDTIKGSFIKKVSIASTMGFGLEVNLGDLR